VFRRWLRSTLKTTSALTFGRAVIASIVLMVVASVVFVVKGGGDPEYTLLIAPMTFIPIFVFTIIFWFVLATLRDIFLRDEEN
jgi:hypothetical protein